MSKTKLLLRSTLELLILKSLVLEPLHGVGIASRIHQITQSAIQVSFGSLFPALHRMEEKGWLLAEWRISEHNRRAKYYALTKSGRKQLREEQRQWSLVVKALPTALRST
jgi:transcriptional regulator